MDIEREFYALASGWTLMLRLHEVSLFNRNLEINGLWLRWKWLTVKNERSMIVYLTVYFSCGSEEINHFWGPC